MLIAIPGPSVMFVIGRALSLGRGPAIASVTGSAVGVYVVAVLVAFGLGTLVQDSDAAFTVIKLADGLYLLWLGSRRSGSPRRLAAVGGAGGLARIGVGVSVAVTGRHN